MKIVCYVDGLLQWAGLVSLSDRSRDLIYYAALLPRRGRILRRTLSVRLSVRPSRYRCHR